MNATNKQIIITGNIGTGKSTVTYIFEKKGYKIISADEISANILEQYQVNVSKIFSLPPQNFDSFKKRLGALVFGDITIKKELEDFMLPFIQEEIERLAVKYTTEKQKYVIEAPTYFEVNGLQKFGNKFIILLHSDKDVRVERILKRNPHLSIQDIYDRMNSQINPADKIDFSDKVLKNNGNIDDLKVKVNKLIQKMEKI